MRIPSEITRTFCPTLHRWHVAFVQAWAALTGDALLIITTPSVETTWAFSIELEDVLGWSVVFEQLGPHPLAKVLNLLCFLIRRRA